MNNGILKNNEHITQKTQYPEMEDPAIKTIGQIDDVNTEIIPYIKARYSKRAIEAAVVLVVFEIVWLSYYFKSGIAGTDDFNGRFFITIAVIPIVIAFYSWKMIKNRIEDAFMEQFAICNNFSFKKNGLPYGLDGSLFSIGYAGCGTDMVSGRLNNLSLCLFNYQYTVGHGKYSHTYNYTVFKLDYPNPLPPIFLQVKGAAFGESILDHFTKNDPEKIQLEGDFNNYFSLYGKKGFEIEILQIFTPDFMQKIQNEWNNFSLEFIGNHLFIYSYHTITTKAELDNIYSLAKYLIAKIEPLAKAMKSDLQALENIGTAG